MMFLELRLSRLSTPFVAMILVRGAHLLPHTQTAERVTAKVHIIFR
jgi:hypothetical protein